MTKPTIKRCPASQYEDAEQIIREVHSNDLRRGCILTVENGYTRLGSTPVPTLILDVHSADPGVAVRTSLGDIDVRAGRDAPRLNAAGLRLIRALLASEADLNYANKAAALQAMGALTVLTCGE